MKQEKIVQFGDPALRHIASPVTVFHKKLRGVIDTIAFTLNVKGDGAALAAPQIGILRRITVIDYQNEYIEMVNPQILEMSGAIAGNEGCLSFQGYSGEVTRAETVTVKFQDRFGIECTLTRSGPMARCIQHEIDHLDGILYVDRMDKNKVVVNDKHETLDVETVIAMSKTSVTV